MEKAYRDEAVYGLAELFKIFGDPTRIRILYAMLDTERCVNDIAGILQMSQSSVSHQLPSWSRADGRASRFSILWMTSTSGLFSTWEWNTLWKERENDKNL